MRDPKSNGLAVTLYGQYITVIDFRFMLDRLQRIMVDHDSSMYELGVSIWPLLFGLWLMFVDVVHLFPGYFSPLTTVPVPIWVMGFVLFILGVGQLWSVLMNQYRVRKWLAACAIAMWVWFAWLFYIVTPQSPAVPTDFVFALQNLCTFLRLRHLKLG